MSTYDHNNFGANNQAGKLTQVICSSTYPPDHYPFPDHVGGVAQAERDTGFNTTSHHVTSAPYTNTTSDYVGEPGATGITNHGVGNTAYHTGGAATIPPTDTAYDPHTGVGATRHTNATTGYGHAGLTNATNLEGFEDDPTMTGRANVVQPDIMQTPVDAYHNNYDDNGDVMNTHLGGGAHRVGHKHDHDRVGAGHGTTGVDTGHVDATAEHHHVSLAGKIKGTFISGFLVRILLTQSFV